MPPGLHWVRVVDPVNWDEPDDITIVNSTRVHLLFKQVSLNCCVSWHDELRSFFIRSVSSRISDYNDKFELKRECSLYTYSIVTETNWSDYCEKIAIYLFKYSWFHCFLDKVIIFLQTAPLLKYVLKSNEFNEVTHIIPDTFARDGSRKEVLWAPQRVH